jgi:hypothetical protein
MTKWYFGPSASEEHGPNDSITTTFKGDKYYSLAREVIQNSLDAKNDLNAPVKVQFSLFELNRTDIPHLFELKDIFKLCAKYYSSHNQFKDFCANAAKTLSSDSITCLRISDFNTSGLEHSNDNQSKFYAFMKAVGVTNKPNSGAGGSYGFGKGAYYAASSVRTIIVSSVYGDNKYIFQGKARLTTHEDTDGVLKDYTGLLGLTGREPITDISTVPDILKRADKGTDITIVGFQKAGDWKESLIKSVLNNFWLSIWLNELIVEIEGTVIKKETLENIISTYYNENSPDGSVNEPETWNPYPYFKAIKYAGDTNTKSFEKLLPTLGKVKLNLLLREGLPNRTVFLRSPKMVVYKKTDNRGFNYAGVFLCDNTEGNKILRQMENPQHNEWKKNNFLDNDKPHADAKKAEDELKAFMKECLESLMTIESNKRQKITGLDKYLNIPEDLSPEDEGSGEATGGGKVTKEKVKNETAIETTEKIDETPVILEVTKKTSIANKEEGEAIKDGDTTIISGVVLDGPPKPPGPPGPPGPVPGATIGTGTTVGTNPIKRLLNITYRVIAQKNSTNEIIHLLKINSPKNANAEIDLFVGVDNEVERDDSLLSITSASIGATPLSVIENKVKNIPLIAGWNIINIKFDSNQKHSLKLKSYEV